MICEICSKNESSGYHFKKACCLRCRSLFQMIHRNDLNPEDFWILTKILFLIKRNNSEVDVF
jgi:uncharacterized paraquat-inducible protein A